MPRRSILSINERTNLLTMPENQDDLIRYQDERLTLLEQ